MQGTIALTLGLALHANAFLQDRDIGAFWPEASFFAFCRSVRFLAVDRDGAETEIAADPAAWLRRPGSRCRGVRVKLDWGDDDMTSVAFAGHGSGGAMAKVGGDGPLGWQPRWSVSRDEADADRPWSVAYRGVPTGAWASAPRAELDRAGQDLESALRAIAGFAERIGSHHKESFGRALGCLSGDGPGPPSYYLDLAPPGFLSPEARRLLAASQAAWVFGGMGSWNDEDYGVEGNGLTETLFGRLQAALAAVVDSTLPQAPAGVTRPSPTSPSDR
ncbi:MAG TPA: hypothetical protein VFP12_10010 [Allosphingosinicella sp.]|nr:hypothetical protein [Allosphingosinicella sp.]